MTNLSEYFVGRGGKGLGGLVWFFRGQLGTSWLTRPAIFMSQRLTEVAYPLLLSCTSGDEADLLIGRIKDGGPQLD